MEGIFFSESPEWAVRTCEQSVEISTMANRFRHQEVERSPVLTLGPATAGVQPIAQACVPYCLYRVADRARNGEHQKTWNTRKTTWPSQVSAHEGQPN